MWLSAKWFIKRRRKNYANILRQIRNTDNLGRMKHLLESIDNRKKITYTEGLVTHEIRIEMIDGYSFGLGTHYDYSKIIPSIALRMIRYNLKTN